MNKLSKISSIVFWTFKSILHKICIKVLPTDRDVKSIEINGPDIYIFPDVAGCYAVRTAPKRWDMSYSHFLLLFAPNGSNIGKYHTNVRVKIERANGFLPIVDKDINGSFFTSVAGGRSSRPNMSLKNAIRHCYLSCGTSDWYKNSERPILFTANRKMLMAQTDKGFGIFKHTGEMVGFIIDGHDIKYFPTSCSDMNYVLSEDNKSIKSSEALRDNDNGKKVLEYVFRYIDKKEKDQNNSQKSKPIPLQVQGGETMQYQADVLIRLGRLHDELEDRNTATTFDADRFVAIKDELPKDR